MLQEKLCHANQTPTQGQERGQLQIAPATLGTLRLQVFAHHAHRNYSRLPKEMRSASWDAQLMPTVHLLQQSWKTASAWLGTMRYWMMQADFIDVRIVQFMKDWAASVDFGKTIKMLDIANQ